MKKQNEIKPCPFCGKPSHGYMDEENGYFIMCSFCGARSSMCHSEYDAQARWNKRNGESK